MKIQRFEGVEGYGDRTLDLGGYSQKKQTYRSVKLFILALISLCLLAALQTTVLSRLPLPLLPSAAPSLCLLFTLAAGYLFGEREGCVCGLMAGLITECAHMEPFLGGIMILPLMYCVLGYISGALSQRVLAGNLPSFLVYAAVGIMTECLYRLVMTILSIKGLPPLRYFTGELLSVFIVTVLLSPLVYLSVKAGRALFDKRI